MKNTLIVICAFLFTSLAHAGLISNGSFENGFNSWDTNNNLASVVSSYTASNGSTPVSMYATDGNQFAILQANKPATSIWSSAFTVGIGDVLLLDSFYDSKDYPPFNDKGLFWLKMVSGNTTILSGLLGSVGTVGSYGLSGWTTHSFTMTTSGNVKLMLSSTNGGDNNLDSVLGIDNVRVNRVPEPGTLALASLAGVGLAGFTRRKKKTA